MPGAVIHCGIAPIGCYCTVWTNPEDINCTVEPDSSSQRRVNSRQTGNGRHRMPIAAVYGGVRPSSSWCIVLPNPVDVETTVPAHFYEVVGRVEDVHLTVIAEAGDGNFEPSGAQRTSVSGE